MRWSRRNISIFLLRLELYLNSGLTIDAALRLCRDGVPSKFRKSVDEIINHAESGSLLSIGLSKYMRLDRTSSRMIAHGETTGELSRAIMMARSSIEKDDELIKKCVSAAIYPSVIACFSGIFVIGLMKGVMPQIIPMLNGLHTDLPLISRVMITLSDLVMKFGIIALIIMIVIILLFVLLYKKQARVRFVAHSVFSIIPLFGNLVANYNIIVFLRSFGALVQSGLPLAKAFHDSAYTIDFGPVSRPLIARTEEVSRGLSIGQALGCIRAPQYVVALVSAGESSGTLGISISRAADILDQDMENSLKRLTSLIEPIMMIAMGAIVGAIALSIIMPIYDLSKALQH